MKTYSITLTHTQINALAMFLSRSPVGVTEQETMNSIRRALQEAKEASQATSTAPEQTQETL